MKVWTQPRESRTSGQADDLSFRVQRQIQFPLIGRFLHGNRTNGWNTHGVADEFYPEIAEKNEVIFPAAIRRRSAGQTGVGWSIPLRVRAVAWEHSGRRENVRVSTTVYQPMRNERSGRNIARELWAKPTIDYRALRLSGLVLLSLEHRNIRVVTYEIFLFSVFLFYIFFIKCILFAIFYTVRKKNIVVSTIRNNSLRERLCIFFPLKNIYLVTL